MEAPLHDLIRSSDEVAGSQKSSREGLFAGHAVIVAVNRPWFSRSPLLRVSARGLQRLQYPAEAWNPTVLSQNRSRQGLMRRASIHVTRSEWAKVTADLRFP